MSALLEYMNKHENPVGLIHEEFGIRVKSYDNGFYVFNYSQIDSPKTNPVVMESRGAILKEVHGVWTYFARPFKRFFNYGEAPDTLTDFKFERSEVMEKADGSLIKIWYDGMNWQIATRGTAYAESENYTGELFRDLVLGSLGSTVEEFQWYAQDHLTRGMTHMYELISPNNRVVTPYDKSELVYLGSVDNMTGEFSYQEWCVFCSGMREVKTYCLNSVESCVEAAKELDGLSEGFVVRDLKSGQAVKIKSPLYVAAHHARGDYGLTPKKAAKLVVTNESDEYLKYFPEDEDKIGSVQHHWDVIKGFIHNVWNFEVSGIESQKDFAMRVKDLPYSAVMFRARSHNEDPIKVLHSMPEKYKMDLLIGWMEKANEH